MAFIYSSISIETEIVTGFIVYKVLTLYSNGML